MGDRDTVLDAIRNTRGPVQPRDLERATGLERRTIERMLDELKRRGNVAETERDRWVFVKR